MINELAKQIHQNNKEKGFYDGPKNIGEMIALIHSEASEALEADRHGKYANLSDSQFHVLLGWVSGEDFKQNFTEQCKDTFEDELADIMIRVMDLAAFKGIDLERHIRAKVRYNKLRPHKHGKKY